MCCRFSGGWKITTVAMTNFAAGKGRCGSPTRHRAIRLFAALIKAAGEVGIVHNPDYNGASQDGIAMSQATIASGRRMSTARCYLEPIRHRKNLHIETSALTEGCCAGRKALCGCAIFRAGGQA